MLALAVTAAALAVASCRNPFQTYPDEYGRHVGRDILRSAQVLPLADKVSKEPAPQPGAKPSLERRPDPFAAAEKRDVSIEQCRAWTLENNLNLRVAMVDPQIKRTALSEEEARFEAAFVANMGFSEADRSRSLVFPDEAANPFDLSAGVVIPLRTGGTATVRLPVERNETFPGSSGENRYSTDVEVSISQPLLRNAGRWTATHPIRLAALDSQIAQAQTKLEVIRQIADVDRAYWLLYEARRLLEVRQEQFEQADQQLERARSRFRGQLGPEIEVYRAEAGVSRRLTSIIVTELLVKDRQRDLKRIINLPGADVDSAVVLLPISKPDPVRYALEGPSLMAAALDKRMELLELELRLAQDMSTIDFTQNQRLPSFTLDYAYRFDGFGSTLPRSLSNLGNVKSDGWIVRLGAQVPLGNEAADARAHRALLTRLQRLATRSAREQSIKQEVLGALDNLEATWQRIMAAGQDVVLEGKNYDVEKGQYNLGLRNSTEVLDAETRLANAKANEVSAIVEYQIAQTDLAFATGMLLGHTRVSW